MTRRKSGLANLVASLVGALNDRKATPGMTSGLTTAFIKLRRRLDDTIFGIPRAVSKEGSSIRMNLTDKIKSLKVTTVISVPGRAPIQSEYHFPYPVLENPSLTKQYVIIYRNALVEDLPSGQIFKPVEKSIDPDTAMVETQMPESFSDDEDDESSDDETQESPVKEKQPQRSATGGKAVAQAPRAKAPRKRTKPAPKAKPTEEAAAPSRKEQLEKSKAENDKYGLTAITPGFKPGMNIQGMLKKLEKTEEQFQAVLKANKISTDNESVEGTLRHKFMGVMNSDRFAFIKSLF